MATFEEIRKANEAIKTTDIKGKEYAEVNQRIKAFRMVYPNGSIQTDIISLADGVVTMQAKITNEDGVVIGTGYAQEKESSSYINKTSYIENCETSAVGRALGMCGFGIDTSVASYEEVANAIENQNKPENLPCTTLQAEEIRRLYTPLEISKMLGRMKKNRLEDVSVTDANTMIIKRKEENEKKGK